MKRSTLWVSAFLSLAATFTGVAAFANPVQTPLGSPVRVSGTATGGQEGQCGSVGSAPAQVVVVNQPTPLRFQVQGQGQPTLYITGPVDRCVMADGYSGGNIEVPGVWRQGTYQIFVGNLAQGSHPFTLSITQENQ